MRGEHLKPYHFKPGVSGNPSGRPILPDELRAIRSLNQVEACKLISKYARMTKDELLKAVDDESTPVIELSIASIFSKCVENGDYTRLSFLLDRAIGKVPSIAESDEETLARAEIQSLSDQELLRLITEKLPELTSIKSEE